MKQAFSLALLLLLTSSACRSQEPLVRMTVLQDTTEVRIAFAGDMMGHGPQIEAAWNDSLKAYQYTPVFKYVQNEIKAADIAVVNLEVTLAGRPYSGYPQFSSPDVLAKSLKEVGFDLLLTANNHCLDRGKEGMQRTLQVLDSANIKHIGTFADSVSRKTQYPYITEANNIRIAFLNYTYGTNGYRPQKPTIVNYIDTLAMQTDIAIAKQAHVDFVVIILHWGAEYEREPNDEQKATARFLRNCRVDAIVGSHPHVVQPFENLLSLKDSLTKIPVIYSLGNFVSNQRERYKDGGILFTLELQKTKRTVVKSCSYTPMWVFRGSVNGKQQYRLVSPNTFDLAKTELNMSSADSAKCALFFEDTRSHLNMLTESNK